MNSLEGLLIPIVAIVSVFGGGVAVVWIVARAFTERTRARKEELDNLLQRFDDADEFTRFAETPAGERLVESITSGRSDDVPRATKSLHRGLITGFLGLGFLLVALTYEFDMIVPALILMGLGAGFLVSAYVTNRMGGGEADAAPAPGGIDTGAEGGGVERAGSSEQTAGTQAGPETGRHSE